MQNVEIATVAYATTVDLVNREGDKADSVITFTGYPVDGEVVVVGDTTYEFDTNSEFTEGTIPVVVPVACTVQEATLALYTAMLNDPVTTARVYGLEDDAVRITSRLGGTASNAIPTNTDVLNASFDKATLEGGTDTETTKTVCIVDMTEEKRFIPTGVMIFADNITDLGETKAEVTLGMNSTDYNNIVENVELTVEDWGVEKLTVLPFVNSESYAGIYSVVTCPSATEFTVTFIVTGYYL